MLCFFKERERTSLCSGVKEGRFLVKSFYNSLFPECEIRVTVKEAWSQVLL